MTDSGKPSARGASGDAGKDTGGKPAWRRGSGSAQPPAEPALDDRTLVGKPLPPEPPQPVRAVDPGEPGASTTTSLTEELRKTLPVIPGLTILREIGRGGMGIVYLGKQGYLDRRVAVKVLKQGDQSEEFTRRFQREAKILAALSHPHIVGCYQAGVAPDGRCYLAMEYIDGPTLGDWIQQHGPLPQERAVELCRSVASALAHAHRSGIIHRDVKPANVLLNSAAGSNAGDPFPYQPKLADLGLARPTKDFATVANLSVQGLTIQGTVMGSPPTMAPEQFDNPDQVDFRTDIYGLGCVLFHCLTGKLAFPQESLTKLISRKMAGKPPDPRELRRDTPTQLAELVCAMLASKREDRPASYEELLKKLEGPFEPVRARPSKKLVLAGGVVVVGGAVWLASALLGGKEAPLDEQQDGKQSAELARGKVPEPPVVDRPRDDAAPDPPLGGRQTAELGTTLGAGELELEKDRASADPSTGGAQPEHETVADENPKGTREEEPIEREPDHSGAEVQEPVQSGFELPDLGPIGTSELHLFLAPERKGQQSPLDEWRAPGGSPGWERSDTGDGVYWLLYEGHSIAERGLPDPPWTLSGKMKLNRPERTPTRRLVLALQLQEGRGIMLEQAMTDDAVQLSGWLGRREASGWVAEEELTELSFDPLKSADYAAASPVTFEVSWNGELLVLEWNLSATEGGPSPRRTELSREKLREIGHPVGLGLELDRGAATLFEFILRGA